MGATVSLPTLPGLRALVQPDEILVVLDDEQGAGKTPAIAAYDSGPYTATINGALQGVPKHYWRAAWPYPLAQNTVIRTPAQCIAQGLTLPYGDCGISIPAPAKQPWGGPMDLAGLVAYEGTTGERPEIGFHTEKQAWWLETGDASYMLDEINGFYALGVHIFDPAANNGLCWDQVAHPYDQTYGPNQGGGYYIGPSVPANTPNPGQRPGVDNGHNPSPFAPYLATGQTRYLHLLQLWTARCMLQDNAWSTADKQNRFILSQGQTRSCAWVLRDILQTYVATKLEEAKGALVPYLRPSSYWKTILDNQLDFFTKTYMQNPAFQAFGFVCNPVFPSPWQQDYFNIVAGYAALILPEWRPFYIWLLRNLVPRLTSKHGWAPGLPTTYRLPLGPGFMNVLAVTPQMVPTFQASQFYSGWDTLLQGFLTNAATQVANLTAAQVAQIQANPNQQTTYDRYSILDTHAAAGIAVWLDRQKLPGLDISAAWPELEDGYANLHAMVLKQNFMAARVSIAVTPKGGAPIPQPVPVPVTPPPPPVPPPAPPPAPAPAPAPTPAAMSNAAVLAELKGIQSDAAALLARITALETGIG